MDATKHRQDKPIKIKKRPEKKPSPSSWGAMGIFSCKNSNDGNKNGRNKTGISIRRSISCAGSICSTKESSVLRSCGSNNGSISSRCLKPPGDSSSAAVSASSSFNSATPVATTATTSSSSSSSSALSSPLSSVGGSFRATQLRKLAGGYDCDEAFPCAGCGEAFDEANVHAVSELDQDDTSRNIVEIIFQSSWIRKRASVCKMERVLKVHSTEKTLQKFEQYKECVRERASREAKKNPRCVADGNELLRFHCTTFACSLGGASGATLCRRTSPPGCNLCGIIRDGFRVDGDGKIAMMAMSGRAHDAARALVDGEKRAMLVCRVVAGRVKKGSGSAPGECECECDSVSSCSEGAYSDLDALYVFNPRAILPCFVVIYSGY